MPTWKQIAVKFVSFGAGFGVALVIGFLIVTWWSERPKPWKDAAIAATATGLMFQQVGEELHLSFRYALKNSTNAEYILPPTDNGMLMRTLSNKSLEPLKNVTWDSSVRIPPGQTVNETFQVVYRFSDYDTSAEELYGKQATEMTKGQEPSKALLDFVNRRTKEIHGLVFMDYLNHYKISMSTDFSHVTSE